MALGLCPECEKLVSITARGMHLRKDGSRSDRMPEWYPVKHQAPDGKPCDGDKKAII